METVKTTSRQLLETLDEIGVDVLDSRHVRRIKSWTQGPFTLDLCHDRRHRGRGRSGAVDSGERGSLRLSPRGMPISGCPWTNARLSASSQARHTRDGPRSGAFSVSRSKVAETTGWRRPLSATHSYSEGGPLVARRTLASFVGIILMAGLRPQLRTGALSQAPQHDDR